MHALMRLATNKAKVFSNVCKCVHSRGVANWAVTLHTLALAHAHAHTPPPTHPHPPHKNEHARTHTYTHIPALLDIKPLACKNYRPSPPC